MNYVKNECQILYEFGRYFNARSNSCLRYNHGNRRCACNVFDHAKIEYLFASSPLI